MKILIVHFCVGLATVAVASWANASPAAAASSAKATTNSIPRSEFALPSNRGEGRDPFFPQSTRLTAVTNVEPVVVSSPARLVLQGISGTTGQRYAIINGQTVTEGETADVSSNGSRLRFRCLDIRDRSCVVEIGSERRELFLRGVN